MRVVKFLENQSVVVREHSYEIFTEKEDGAIKIVLQP